MTAIIDAAGRVCAWKARDVLAGLVIAMWGICWGIQGDAYPSVGPLEWIGGLGLVLGAVAKFYAAPPPPDEGGGL